MRTLVVIVLAGLLWPAVARAAVAVPGSAAPVITPPPPPVATPDPALRDLAVTCRKRRGKPCRIRVAFALDRAGRATLAFARVKDGKAKRIGSVKAAVRPPRARIDVAKVAGKALKPGRYKVTVTVPGLRPGSATVRVR